MTTLTPLQIAQEAYVNVFKDRYGVRPRFVTEEQWNDIHWLTNELHCEADQRDWHWSCAKGTWVSSTPVESLSYFEELLLNLEDSDYDR